MKFVSVAEPIGTGVQVKYYRLYLLANADGRFVGFEEIEAADDVEAVRFAQDYCGRHALELWCGARKIKSFAAQPVAAAG
jgi:hypothetical protein